ncbi:polysaccharide lyase [Caulifigura coniformis]|uniref:polysaccharide lyase n=1 Tax=Caulifigura coniformis TaxID=2527983 RepID=UPI0011AA9F73|nr:hypothetical protein [Caulifigura coniformis]
MATVGLVVRAAEPAKAVVISGDAGMYPVARWKADWPGCEYEDGVKEGRVSVVRREAGNALRITCKAGAIGPADGGAGWRYPYGRSDDLTISYTVCFDPDFEFVKGGKLPGISGGPESVTGGRPADGMNGFSARLMWRKDGRGEAYVYHMHQPGKYGESFPFPSDFRFVRGEPTQVRIQTRMNRPGQRDGALLVWIQQKGTAEQLVVERRDMEWRREETFGADSVQFEVFHGGGDASWAPKTDSHLEIGQIRVDRR